MAEGGEGEQDDVSFLRTVNSPLKTLILSCIFLLLIFRKTWCVFRARTLENVSACLLKDLEIGTVS